MIRKFFTAAVLFAAASVAQAQFTPANSPVQITSIDPTLESSPEFNVPIGPQRKAASQKWLWIEVSFTYKGTGRPPLPTDTNDVEFNYYILLKNTSPQNRTGTLLVSAPIILTGVSPGKDVHHSLALVSPQTLKSFFNGNPPASVASAVQAIGVTAKVGGQLAAELSTGPGKGKPQWWLQLPPQSGLVLSKDQTPFAPLFYDYFEAVKPKGSGSY